MSGTIPGFDPDEFRNALRFAMDMGAPNDAAQRATFYFPKTVTATGPTDASGAPYSPDAAVTRAQSKPPVTVSCAIEDAAGSADETRIGRFGDGIIITLFDEEFAQVTGFEFVGYRGLRYDYDRELLGSSLGSVDIHRLLCIAEGAR